MTSGKKQAFNEGLRPSMSSLARSCPRKRGRDLAPFVNEGSGAGVRGLGRFRLSFLL